MTHSNDELAFLLQSDWHENRVNRIGTESWITVYSNSRADVEQATLYCALLPDERVAEALKSTSWDFSIGDGLPGCSIYHLEDSEEIIYHRFGNDRGIEPLVICRSFHDIRPPYVEILEEFRLFHNLFFIQSNNSYVKIDDNGGEQTVVKIDTEAVSIRLKDIRQFLAIKEMHLAIFFDVVRFSRVDFDVVPEGQRQTEVNRDLMHYEIYIAESEFFTNPEYKTFSRLLGKKLIPGFSKSKSGIWPYNEKKEQFENFVIGLDEDGEPVNYTCDPSKLSNHFGANPNAPHYLTPVFFRPEVLSKYYASPGRYSVEDGYLRCGSLWGVRIDNNHSRYIVVFLGDLGRDLPYHEQLYWRSFNVIPEGGISSVNFRRSFLAEFTDPERPDLFFKFSFAEFQKQWLEHQSWYLFKPLSSDDQYLFTALRVPVTNEQAELDSQVLALTKIMIDSLNEEQIESLLGGLDPDIKGGISKFEKFLSTKSFPEYEVHIKFLRNLQSLRSSSVGHRKGRNYKKIAREFGIGEKDIREVFENILSSATQLLEALSNHFLPKS